MDAHRWIESVEADGRELGRLCRERPDTTVRSCPDWTGADLLAHAAGFCRTLDGLFAGTREARDPAIVVPPSEALQTYDVDLAALLRLLRETDPGTRVVNWSVLEDDAAYWVRRAAHEFAIHRWDAATTGDGEPAPLPADLARDGIAEFFEAFVATAFAYGFMPPNEATLVVELTDLDETLREDLPRPGPTTTIRGTASDIVLAFWHRRAPTDFHVDGDRAILEAWPHI
ncbi:maleylpyruvate isomerase family mycothiol-dependent enzyme [Actinomycetospora termitidis]|uniref:Maleylpyruvate isomerase family mycothiol-dependent enzyme n=1 Tax=Actinomycetospora termitidis TaxID=3053470 RepID=A0ABT7M782_9PSEU|nr:maleylpyruvate isomerase family mycothiol-dependent enzyme [Actinomycetospora sp. Odt1-22]MDL5156534.1 maleylpyruvate isomerase family mycothiol-dependent enzyme [Actinomycetospora sp. Odt1-22]